MSNQATKTNNDTLHLEAKILLRLNNLPKKNKINVLEAFGGDGILWKEVKKRTDKNIKILSIDKKQYKTVNLKGDNIKFLMSFDLNKFDIIDLDAWGSPSNQLEILHNKNYKGIVHCTFIQSMLGQINTNILLQYGYTEQMIKKCPTLFSKNGLDKFLYYINKKFDVTEIYIHSHKKKNYFVFVIN